MKTITLTLYSFDELNEKSKKVAIENQREFYHENNDFAEWAIDDCSLLEPPHEELITLFGGAYNFPLLKNNRKIYFDLDRNRHIDISEAMEVTNNYQFLRWLGLSDELIDKTVYKIGKDTIFFEEYSFGYDFTQNELEELDFAIDKFQKHCQNILKSIETIIEGLYSDESITEDLINNEYLFTEDGEKNWYLQSNQ